MDASGYSTCQCAHKKQQQQSFNDSLYKSSAVKTQKTHAESAMPVSGPVYQPTTVTYEQQQQQQQQQPGNGGGQQQMLQQQPGGPMGPSGPGQQNWTRPVSYLSQTVASPPNKARMMQWFILLLGITLLSTGLCMVIHGAIGYSKIPPTTNSTDPTGSPTDASSSQTGDLIVAFLGAFFSIVGIFLLGVYIRSCRRRKLACSWWRGKDLTSSSSTRENGVAASAAMNPSTDLLVTAQYAPVSEVAYQPPAALAAEERSKLMENKDCVSGEESDRMLESDPRIVLRPTSHVEENA